MLKGLKLEAPDELLACRICLVTDTNLYGILEHRLDEAFIDITGTTLSAWDGYPQHVCAACARALRRAHAVRSRTARAQLALKRILALHHTITTEYIRAVDRAATDLCLPLTMTVCPAPIECRHGDFEDIKVELPLLSPSPLLPPASPLPPSSPSPAAAVSPKEEDGYSLKCEDNSDDDVALSALQRPREKKRRVVRKQKTKKVKTEKKRERRKTEKIRDEDFPAFEREYNFDVVILSHEQQIEDLAARKEKDNYRNSLFKCEKCFKGFYTEATLANHNVKHHDETVGPHECELCQCRFRIPAILRRHLATHRLRFVCQHCGFTARDRSHAMTHSKEHRGLRYECQYCGDSFKKRSTYGTHVRIQHPNENKSCDVCGETFLGALGLALHKKKSHRQHPNENKSCDVCGETFLGALGLALHKKKSHRQVSTSIHIQHPNENKSCDVCGETFLGALGLALHKKKSHRQVSTSIHIQHPNENKSCDVCGETFLGALGLALHKKKSHRQAVGPGAAACAACGVCFESECARARHVALAAKGCQHIRPCAICGENFKDEEALQAHVRERHQDRQTQCQECDMTFASEASRSVHYERVHLKVKVRRCLPKTGRKYDRYGDHFMCEMCGKKCQNNIALKYHIRSHTGEKPHACPHCPKHYSTPVALQYHIRSHTGDKPLACPHCPLRYATHKGLQTHLLKHTGERPFKCEICFKAFTQKTMLQKHKTVHTGEKPFACDICGKTFTQSGSVHTHVKYVHKKLPAPPRNRGKHKVE